MTGAHLVGVEPAPEPASRRRLAPAAAAAVLLAIAAALFLVFRPGFGDPASGSARSLQPHVAAVIQLRPLLTHVAVAGDAVWVSSVDSGTAGNGAAPGLLWRIDARTNKHSRPLALADGIDGLALVGSSIWVVDGQSLRRVDAATGKVTSTVAGVSAGLIVSGAGALWAGGQRISLPKLEVRSIALPTGAVVASAGPVGVWATGDQLYRLDPRTGSVVARVDRPGFRPVAIAETDDALWVAYSSRTERELTSLVRVDPGTNRIAGRAIDLRGHLPAAVAVAEGAVWLLTYNQEEEGARLWQVDPDRGRLVGRALRLTRGTPFLLAAGAHALWVGEDLDLGTVTRVDLGR